MEDDEEVTKVARKDMKQHQHEKEQLELDKAKNEYLRLKKIAQRGGGDGERIQS